MQKASRLADILEKAYEGDTREDVAEAITRLRSEYVNEMNIEQAERLLKHRTPNIANVIRLLTEMRDRDPRACLRLPAFDGWPETRWRMQGGVISVSLRDWKRHNESGQYKAPNNLFQVRPTGVIETDHAHLRDSAYATVSKLGAAPESLLRQLGKQKRTCPVCRRHLSEFYAPRGLHPSCESLAGFEVGPTESHNKISKESAKQRKAAERLFTKA